MFKGTYIVYGSDPSYFTQKMRAILRYKAVPHEYRQKAPDREEVETRAGTHLIPIVRTPEDWIVWDTTAISWMLEERFPASRIWPSTPRQRIAAMVIEDMIDEWLTRLAVHFRWCYDEDRRERGRAIALAGVGLPENAVLAPDEESRIAEAAEAVANGFGDRVCRVLSAGKENEAEMLAIYRAVLGAIDKAVADRPYLFGRRASIADLGFVGSMVAHFGADPTPRRIMREETPRVFDYMRRGFDDRYAGGSWLAEDEVPEAVADLLRLAGQGFHAFLEANHRALGAGERHAVFDGGFGEVRIAARGFTEHCRQFVADQIAALPAGERAEVREMLEGAGAFRAFTLPDITARHPLKPRTRVGVGQN